MSFDTKRRFSTSLAPEISAQLHPAIVAPKRPMPGAVPVGIVGKVGRPSSTSGSGAGSGKLSASTEALVARAAANAGLNKVQQKRLMAQASSGTLSADRTWQSSHGLNRPGGGAPWTASGRSVTDGMNHPQLGMSSDMSSAIAAWRLRQVPRRRTQRQVAMTGAYDPEPWVAKPQARDYNKEKERLQNPESAKGVKQFKKPAPYVPARAPVEKDELTELEEQLTQEIAERMSFLEETRSLGGDPETEKVIRGEIAARVRELEGVKGKRATRAAATRGWQFQ